MWLDITLASMTFYLRDKYSRKKETLHLQTVRKNEPCDIIKGRAERRSGKGNPLERVTRQIFSILCRVSSKKQR